jgi:hypothetical protein
LLGFPLGHHPFEFAGVFTTFDVGQDNFTHNRDFSGIANTGGVFAQGGIESFKSGTPSARERIPGDVFVLGLFFHFYPNPNGFVLKENGTIPFYATFSNKFST